MLQGSRALSVLMQVTMSYASQPGEALQRKLRNQHRLAPTSWASQAAGREEQVGEMFAWLQEAAGVRQAHRCPIECQIDGCCKVDQKHLCSRQNESAVARIPAWPDHMPGTREAGRETNRIGKERGTGTELSPKLGKGVKLSSSNLHTFRSNWRSDLDPKSFTDKSYAGARTRKTAT